MKVIYSKKDPVSNPKTTLQNKSIIAFIGMFGFFVTLSFKNDMLFMKEMLVCGGILCFLAIFNTLDRSSKKLQ